MLDGRSIPNLFYTCPHDRVGARSTPATRKRSSGRSISANVARDVPPCRGHTLTIGAMALLGTRHRRKLSSRRGIALQKPCAHISVQWRQKIADKHFKSVMSTHSRHETAAIPVVPPCAHHALQRTCQSVDHILPEMWCRLQTLPHVHRAETPIGSCVIFVP